LPTAAKRFNELKLPDSTTGATSTKDARTRSTAQSFVIAVSSLLLGDQRLPTAGDASEPVAQFGNSPAIAYREKCWIF
jgi:hypothetical protein